MNFPCPIQIPTLLCPGSDSPIDNFSSELPDQLYFVGVGYTPFNPWQPPPLGDGQFTAADCYGVEFSVASQEVANLLAQINPAICQGQQGSISAGGGGGAPLVRVPFYNERQTASGGCSSLSTFTIVIPAASFVVMAFPSQAVGAQAFVNAKALAYAQQQVVHFDFCATCTQVGSINLCLGQVYGSTNLFVMNGAAGNVSWSSTGLPPGIHLTPGTTTAITDSSGDSWVKVGGGIGGKWINLTTGVTQQGQPQGVSSGNTGTADLFGIPTQAGNYVFTVTGTASNGNSSTFKGTISVLGFTTTSPLPNGSICRLYTLPLDAAGGIGPYTFFDANIPGPIPYGLTIIQPNGILHGSLGAGAYQFTLGVRDSLGQECSQLFLLTFDPSATQPSITTATALPNGHANTSYFTPIAVTGGCPSSVPPAYTLAVVSGFLPSNFQLAYSGGWALLGYPGTGDVGSYSFTLKATDWAGQSISKAFTLTIDTNSVVTGSCVGGGPSASGSSPQLTPPGGSRSTAGSEMSNAAAINNLISNLAALGCTCPPLSVTVDPMGKNTTITNTSATCTITMLMVTGYGGPFAIGPGQVFNYNTAMLGLTGNPAYGVATFNLGGGVVFTTNYSS